LYFNQGGLLHANRDASVAFSRSRQHPVEAVRDLQFAVLADLQLRHVYARAATFLPLKEVTSPTQFRSALGNLL